MLDSWMDKWSIVMRDSSKVQLTAELTASARVVLLVAKMAAWMDSS